MMRPWFRLFPKDLRITAFNRGWWFYIVITLLATALFTLCGNMLPHDRRLMLVLITSIIEFIILRIYKFYLIHLRDDYFYFDNLPCFLCNQSTILCIIASLTGNTHIMAFCIILGTAGSFLAFLFPDKVIYDQPFYSVQTLGFYGYHSLLIVTCLSFYTLGLYEPVLTDALWSMLILFILYSISHIVNVIMLKTGLNPVSNYTFTIRPDNAFMEALYRFCPRRFFYMIPALFIAGAISFVILFILRFIPL